MIRMIGLEELVSTFFINCNFIFFCSHLFPKLPIPIHSPALPYLLTATNWDEVLPLRHIKPANQIFSNCCPCYVMHIQSQVLSAFFHIRELIDDERIPSVHPERTATLTAFAPGCRRLCHLWEIAFSNPDDARVVRGLIFYFFASLGSLFLFYPHKQQVIGTNNKII